MFLARQRSGQRLVTKVTAMLSTGATRNQKVILESRLCLPGVQMSTNVYKCDSSKLWLQVIFRQLFADSELEMTGWTLHGRVCSKQGVVTD